MSYTIDDIDTLLRVAARTPFVELPLAFRGTERYELVRELGAGGFGTVYEAIDRVQGGRVALKVLNQARGLYRFKREFRALTRILHPNVVRLYELGSTGPHWFFTMELVEGLPFDRYLARHPERLRPTFAQLAEGLIAIHRAGKLHCDVKPANVLVHANGRPVIVDLGLMVERERDDAVELAGTPPYMAPEVFAGRPPEEASDWYSVGVMLYAALAGQLPYDGASSDVLGAERREPPAPPRRLVPGAPPDLEELCLQLLDRDPARRPDGAEIARRLRADAGPAVPPPMPSFLVGRERELAELRALVEETLHGRRTLVLLRGTSGIGRSAFLRHFVAEVRRELPRVLVLSGACYEHESVPYKALDALIDDLARHLDGLTEAELARLVPRDGAKLAQLFPVLREIPFFRDLQPNELGLDPVERKQRGIAALRTLFRRLGAERPVIACVDDLHWGDLESAQLLEELVRPPDPPALCFIGSLREEDLGTSPLLLRLAELREQTLAQVAVVDLALGALPPEASARLAAGLLVEAGRDAAEAAALARESGGSPFFLEELVRARDPVSGVEEAVEARLWRLPETAVLLLETLALVGRPVDETLLGKLAGLASPPRDVLGLLEAERLVRGRQTHRGRQLETYHDRIGDVAVRRIAAAELPARHARVAEVLEESGQADAEELLAHFRAGHRPERAAHHAELAAARAAEMLAFDRAAHLYRTALSLGGSSPRRPSLQRALGEALVNAGRGAEAAEAFAAAARGAPAAEAFELERRALEQLLRCGRIAEGKQLLAELLERSGIGDAPAGSLLALGLRRARLRLRGTRFRPREAARIPPRVLERIDLLVAASVGLSTVDPIAAVDYQTRATLLALRHGETRRVAQGLVFEACITSIAGSRGARRAHRLLGEARAAARATGNPTAIAHADLARGLIAYFTGRFAEAREHFEVGEQLMRSQLHGMAWERATVQALLLDTLAWLGDLPSLIAQLPARVRDARERGDRLALTGLTSFGASMVLLARDDAAGALDELERAIAAWSGSGFLTQHFDSLHARLNVQLYRGEPLAALDELDRARPALARSQLLRSELMRLKALDVEARAALSAARLGRERERLRRRAAENAARIAREGLPIAAPLALRLEGCLALLDGRRAAARARLAAAAAAFDELQLQLHAIAARRAALVADGRDPAHEDRALERLGVHAPERFARMLAPA